MRKGSNKQQIHFLYLHFFTEFLWKKLKYSNLKLKQILSLASASFSDFINPGNISGGIIFLAHWLKQKFPSFSIDYGFQKSKMLPARSFGGVSVKLVNRFIRVPQDLNFYQRCIQVLANVRVFTYQEDFLFSCLWISSMCDAQNWTNKWRINCQSIEILFADIFTIAYICNADCEYGHYFFLNKMFKEHCTA